MIEWFLSMMATNTVAQGVFAGLIASAPLAVGMWLLRDLPIKIKNVIVSFYEKEICFLSDLDDYNILSTHIDKYILWTRDRTYSEELKKTTVGYGKHYGIYNGVPFKLIREVEKNPGTYNFQEKTKITFYERKHKSIDLYVEEVFKNHNTSLKIYSNSRHGWECIGPLAPRDWDSIFFDGKEKIWSHINKFLSSEKDYLKKGMPWHTGILLYGEPGTGKTSLIKAIANKSRRNIRALNPKNVRESYAEVVEGVWDDSILVIEDIDVSGASVSREDNSSQASLGSLLNSLDGIFTPHGLITIATTNNIDSLDPALVRPGRFDLVIEVGKMSEKEAKDMAKAFNKNIVNYSPKTGAELRKEFLDGQ